MGKAKKTLTDLKDLPKGHLIPMNNLSEEEIEKATKKLMAKTQDMVEERLKTFLKANFPAIFAEYSKAYIQYCEQHPDEGDGKFKFSFPLTVILRQMQGDIGGKVKSAWGVKTKAETDERVAENPNAKEDKNGQKKLFTGEAQPAGDATTSDT
jgi:hypothetical protein